MKEKAVGYSFLIKELNNLKIRKIDANGSTGLYRKINKNLGIKILYDSNGSSTEKTLKRSKEYSRIKKEFKLQFRASIHGVSPRPHKIISVYCLQSERYYPAILMEHLEGRIFYNEKRVPHLLSFGDYKILGVNYVNEIDYLLKKEVKISHNDLNYNIFRCRSGELKVLDFGFSESLR